MSSVPFQVVTPDRVVFSGEVNMVTLRGGYGEIGILPKHAPLATTVQPGIVRVKFPEGEDFIAVSGGFIEVLPTKVTLLADTAELPEDIDLERAQRAKVRAEERLAHAADAVDSARAAKALKRSMIRIETVEFSQRNGMIIASRKKD